MFIECKAMTITFYTYSESQVVFQIDNGKRRYEPIECPNKRTFAPKIIDENWISIVYNNLGDSM